MGHKLHFFHMKINAVFTKMKKIRVETVSQYTVLASFELVQQTNVASSQQRSVCLCLDWSTVMTAVNHHAQPRCSFL